MNIQATQNLPATTMKQPTANLQAATATNTGLKQDVVSFGMGEQAAAAMAEAAPGFFSKIAGGIGKALTAIKDFFIHEDGLVRKALSATWSFIKKLNPLNWFKSAEPIVEKAAETAEPIVEKAAT